MSTQPDPNDQRSNVKNPNNPAYEADRSNRKRLGHDVPPAPKPVVQQPTPPKK